MTLDEWDQKVGRHLQSIEAYAGFIKHHTDDLSGMPEWDTKAVVAIAEAQQVLIRTLAQLECTRRAMEAKERVS